MSINKLIGERIHEHLKLKQDELWEIQLEIDNLTKAWQQWDLEALRRYCMISSEREMKELQDELNLDEVPDECHRCGSLPHEGECG